MPAPTNVFKRALSERRRQIGLWQSLASPYATEICAQAGFDWLLLDAEHGPNDITTLLAQMQGAAAGGTPVVVRPPIGEAWIIKQVLDIGAQTVLVPMVETAEQAQALVRAMRYPPEGVRGVGAALARASRFNAIGDYVETANAETCLLVQVESRAAVSNLDAIAAVEGVDGVFIGPADLSADMGYPGNPAAPEVRGTIDDAIARINAAGKAAGILSFDPETAHAWMAAGAGFVAVGADVALLARGARELAASFRHG